MHKILNFRKLKKVQIKNN